MSRMGPLAVVLKHEWRRVRRDRALPWLVLLFTAISGYAAWNGGAWAEERRAALAIIAEQSQKYRDEVLSSPQRLDPSQRTDVRLLATTLWHHPALPLTPLAPLSIGQAEGYPYDAKFHVLTPAHRMFDALGTSLANPLVRALQFDLAFVLVFLLPLFLLAGIYDVWAQERDQGTASLLLSQPVRLDTLLAAKALARGATLLLCFTLVSMLTLVVAAPGSGAAVGGLLGAAVVIVLYGAFWILLALAVNVFARRSTEAAIACGAGWLAIVVLVPALLSAGLDLARPAPSHPDYVNTLRMTELDLKKQRRAEPVRTEGTASGQPGDGREELFAELRKTEAAYGKVMAQFNDRRADRSDLATALRFWSPAVLAQDAFDRLAGTDADRALAFQHQALAFLEGLRDFVAPYFTGRQAEAANSAHEVPQFAFREPGGAMRVAVLADVAALLAFGLTALVAIGVGLRRKPAQERISGEDRCSKRSV